jgi:DNA-binding response OmpR family regulator
MPTQYSILLIEDSRGEGELFRTALEQTGHEVALFIEHDAPSAFHFLTDRAGREPLPCVILLDWRLQNARGDQFLTRLRSDASFAHIPVVIFTTSDDTSDIAAAYGCRTNGYVVKPATFAQLVRFVDNLCSYWLTWNRTVSGMITAC